MSWMAPRIAPDPKEHSRPAFLRPSVWEREARAPVESRKGLWCLVLRDGESAEELRRKQLMLPPVVAYVTMLALFIARAFLVGEHGSWSMFYPAVLLAVSSSAALLGGVIATRRLSAAAVDLYLLAQIIVAPLADWGSASFGDEEYWQWGLLAIEIMLVLDCRHSVISGAWMITSLWVALRSVEDCGRFGLWEWPFEQGEDSAHSARDWDELPRMLIVRLVPVLFVYHFTRSFALSLRSEQARTQHTIAAAEAIASDLQMYDIHAAALHVVEMGDALPDRMRCAFEGVLVNLQTYLPFLPQSCLPTVVESSSAPPSESDYGSETEIMPSANLRGEARPPKDDVGNGTDTDVLMERVVTRAASSLGSTVTSLHQLASMGAAARGPPMGHALPRRSPPQRELQRDLSEFGPPQISTLCSSQDDFAPIRGGTFNLNPVSRGGTFNRNATAVSQISRKSSEPPSPRAPSRMESAMVGWFKGTESQQCLVPASDLKRKKVTLIVANIRAYLRYVLSSSPDLVAALHWEVLGSMVSAAARYKAITDGISADRFSASINASRVCSGHRLKGVQLAWEYASIEPTPQTVHSMPQSTLSSSVECPPLAISCGVSSGELLCGHVGCATAKRFAHVGPAASWVHACERLATRTRALCLVNGLAKDDAELEWSFLLREYAAMAKASHSGLRAQLLWELTGRRAKVETDEWMYQMEALANADPGSLYNKARQAYYRGDTALAAEHIAKGRVRANSAYGRLYDELEADIAQRPADGLGLYEEGYLRRSQPQPRNGSNSLTAGPPAGIPALTRPKSPRGTAHCSRPTSPTEQALHDSPPVHRGRERRRSSTPSRGSPVAPHHG